MATTIAQAAFSLARRGKGALIVIPRRDSVAEHLTAGTAIEGRLSSALIEAIFTSTSSLHDGAIVVGRNRLSRAGVILPLATDSAAADSDDDLGTRHRAALGLTDNCDALVVCVSEERGAVSSERSRVSALSAGCRRRRRGSSGRPSGCNSSGRTWRRT
jgi:diadenylate cyclase